MESTGRSGLGLSYNVRTGSGILGERGRESLDPAVQDLLLSLREAKVNLVCFWFGLFCFCLVWFGDLCSKRYDLCTHTIYLIDKIDLNILKV